MFPLLRTGLVASLFSIGFAHAAELFGVGRLLGAEGGLMERAIFIDAYLGPLRLGVVGALFVCVSALLAALGVFFFRGGGRAPLGGSLALFFALSLLGLSFFVAQATLTRGVIPLAESALRSDDFTVGAPGSSREAFVSLSNAIMGMGRAAVLDELSRAERLAARAHLALVPFAEALLSAALALFMGRLAPNRVIEGLAGAALLCLAMGAGLTIRGTMEYLPERGLLATAVVVTRLGAVFLLGALALSLGGLRRLSPEVALPLPEERPEETSEEAP